MQFTNNCQYEPWLNPLKAAQLSMPLRHPAESLGGPRHRVVDGLFNQQLLLDIAKALRESRAWQRQRHSYQAHNVSDRDWLASSDQQRFVQREVWLRESQKGESQNGGLLTRFLSFLRGAEFMQLLSQAAGVELSDTHVAEPALNTNYFRMAKNDLVRQHADQSPNRELCLLLYLNPHWHSSWGGELHFLGSASGEQIVITPYFNRCVIFDPASTGSEHWVAALTEHARATYRYNITSWYWSD